MREYNLVPLSTETCRQEHILIIDNITPNSLGVVSESWIDENSIQPGKGLAKSKTLTHCRLRQLDAEGIAFQCECSQSRTESQVAKLVLLLQIIAVQNNTPLLIGVLDQVIWGSSKKTDMILVKLIFWPDIQSKSITNHKLVWSARNP